MTLTEKIVTTYGENYILLPLMFFLPEDWIDRFPTLRLLPRKIRWLVNDEDFRRVILSDRFLDEISDAAALKIFPMLGVNGMLAHYTHSSPVLRVAYHIQTWAYWLDIILDWNLDKLFKYPSIIDIPSFDNNFINDILKTVVKQGIEAEDFQPSLDVMREIPCDEDYENWLTNVRIDFLRRWYHSRTKVGTMSSLEETLMNGAVDLYVKTSGNACSMSEIIASDDYCQRFKGSLSDRDRDILKMREYGYTYKEIAEKLEYKNHSGVVKRMQVIKKAFLEYSSKQ